LALLACGCEQPRRTARVPDPTAHEEPQHRHAATQPQPPGLAGTSMADDSAERHAAQTNQLLRFRGGVIVATVRSDMPAPGRAAFSRLIY
jgi:hypothetical protein